MVDVDLLTGSFDPNGAGGTYSSEPTAMLAAGGGNGNYNSDSTGVDGIICPP